MNIYIAKHQNIEKVVKNTDADEMGGMFLIMTCILSSISIQYDNRKCYMQMRTSSLLLWFQDLFDMEFACVCFTRKRR